jgi:hypothetical protein
MPISAISGEEPRERNRLKQQRWRMQRSEDLDKVEIAAPR